MPVPTPLTFNEVRCWDVSRLCSWLDSAGFGEAKQYCQKEGIDGMTLIKLGPDKMLGRMRSLKKPQKDALGKYLKELDMQMQANACSLKPTNSVPNVPGTAPGPPLMTSQVATAAPDDEFDDDNEEWDDDDEIYENGPDAQSPAITGAPPLPSRGLQPQPPPPRHGQGPPPPPIRSPMTRISTTAAGADEEVYEAPQVTPAPAPPPPHAPPADDEYYEAADINVPNDDEVYEATDEYEINQSNKFVTGPPTLAAPPYPVPHSGPHVPARAGGPGPLPPRAAATGAALPGAPRAVGPPLPGPMRGGPASPLCPQHPPARIAPQPTDDDGELYETAEEPTPPTPKRNVLNPPSTVNDRSQQPASRALPPTPAIQDDLYLAPDASTPPPVPVLDRRPMPSSASGNTPRQVQPAALPAGKQPALPGPGGRAGRLPPPLPTAAQQEDIYEATDEDAHAPAAVPSRVGRPVPAAPPVMDELYEAADAPIPVLPGHKAVPLTKEEPYEPPEAMEEIYEVTDEGSHKPAVPLPVGHSAAPCLPPTLPNRQVITAQAPALPSRNVPVAPSAEEVYESTDDLANDTYADPDDVTRPDQQAPPLPPPTRQLNSDHETGPPRKPPSLPDAPLPGPTRMNSIPSNKVALIAGSDTIKDVKGRLRPIATKAFDSNDRSPGGPPVAAAETKPAPGAPWAGQRLKPVTPRDSTQSAASPPPVVLLLPHITSPPVTLPRSRQPIPSPVNPIVTEEEPFQPAFSPKKTDPLNKFSWYFGSIARDLAMKKIIDTRTEGAFLVRKSEKGGAEFPFTLTVLHSSEVFNIQLRQRQEDQKFALGKPKPKEHVHSTIDDLVKFHKNNEIEVTKSTESCGFGVKLAVSPPK